MTWYRLFGFNLPSDDLPITDRMTPRGARVTQFIGSFSVLNLLGTVNGDILPSTGPNKFSPEKDPMNWVTPNLRICYGATQFIGSFSVLNLLGTVNGDILPSTGPNKFSPEKDPMNWVTPNLMISDKLANFCYGVTQFIGSFSGPNLFGPVK